MLLIICFVREGAEKGQTGTGLSGTDRTEDKHYKAHGNITS